jgi:molecular chaperone GrpE
VGDKVDDSIRQALLSQFGAWLDAVPDTVPDAVPDAGPAEAAPGAELAPTTDLYTLFVEMAGLRAEVRTESRLVKEALEQFRGVFETLQASHATVRQELERARTETRDQVRAAVRPLLLDVIDLRDRLLDAQRHSRPARTGWFGRLFGGNATGGTSRQEGLRLTLRRLDQILLDRRVVAVRLQGQPFDPLNARAIATVADSAAPDGTVIEEVRAGFLWDDQVLRTAEVIVSKSDARTGDTPRTGDAQ